jgi:hypothetical protein
MVKKKYNTDLSEESLKERWGKAGSSINGLDAEGRDNTGEAVDYSADEDFDSATNYVEKVMDVVVGNNDRDNEE